MDQDPEAQEEATLLAVKQRLHERFGSSLGRNTVDRAVETARRRFDASPIRSFIPILVERQATDTLRAAQRAMLARVSGPRTGHQGRQLTARPP